MGMLSRKPKFKTVDADARAYALRMHAPDLIADCFGEYIAEPGTSDAFGALGAYHSAEWWAWCALNVAICPQCEDPWALLVSCVSAWECHHCGFTWHAKVA